jgi:hypothetical protein
MVRAVLILGLTVLLAGTAVAVPAPPRRTILCNARMASMTFAAGKAVIKSGDETTLARVTQKARSLNASCSKYQRLGIARGLLDHNLSHGKITCSGGTRVIIETEPVRNANGRAIGNRVALWMLGLGRELAEVVVAGKKSWFSYASAFCHTG